MTLTVTTSPFFVASDEVEPTVAPAIEYGNPNISVIIVSTVLVSAPNSAAILSNEDGSSLINNGNITGTLGVQFSGNDSTIINNASRTIAGNFYGIGATGSGVTLTNHGDVAGYQDAGISFGSNAALLNNDGEIYGREDGVRIAGGTIDNSGLIRSDGIGVAVSKATVSAMVIQNRGDGTIEGGDDDAITTAGGVILFLNNRGTVNGNIDLNAPSGNVDDVVINSGNIMGDVFLGPGDDFFNGNGGNAVEVFGEGGVDTLIGSKKNDTLDGGNSDDVIRGGRGKDKLFGGDDSDSFDFNSVNESVRGSKRDKIMDFVRGDDEIDLKNIDAKKGVGGNQAFKFIGKHGFHDKKGELRYEDKGAKVIVQGDVDGDGKPDLEILVKVGKLGSDDFVL